MLDRNPRPRGRGIALALAAVAVLATAGAAVAAVGLQNGSFENGLAGWTAEVVGDDATAPADCAGVDGDPRRGVCVVDGDTFTPSGGAPITVEPLDGDRMVRLGGPFTSTDEDQLQDRYRLRQTFVVDPANPVLSLNYNVFLFDYKGYDELRFNVRLTDEGGATITDFAQGGFGAYGDISLKNTGWRSAFIDLAGYEGQQVELTIASGGTRDDLYGFWAYVDAGETKTQPVAAPAFAAPVNPVSGKPVSLNTFSDPTSGQTFVAISPAQLAAFEDGCMPLDLTVPIAPGGGVVSDVSLLADLGSGAETLAMDQAQPGAWHARIPCVATGDLAVQYTVTEAGERATFIVPIGGIALIDPLGVVFDQARYDAAVAHAAPAAAARTAAALEGVTVRLQRQVGGNFRNVLAGDPGITPNVNPEVTGANGQFQWLTSAGRYRVVVSKPGYRTTTSRAVTIPPAVSDLNVGMVASDGALPDDDGDGVPNVSDGCPNVAAATPNGCPARSISPPPAAKPAAARPCAAFAGAKRARCQAKRTLAKAVAACKAGKRNKRATCVKRAKAIAKCASKRGKKRRACVARARRIGARR